MQVSGEDMEMEMDMSDDDGDGRVEEAQSAKGKRSHDETISYIPPVSSMSKRPKYEENGSGKPGGAGDKPFWASTSSNRSNVLAPASHPPYSR